MIHSLSIRQDVVSMNIIVSEFTDGYCVPRLPFIQRCHASLLCLPLTVEQKCFMAIRLLSNPNILFIWLVKACLGVFWVVDASHSMRMSLTNQPIHSFLLESIDCFIHLVLILQGQRISLFKLNRIALKLKSLLRIA